MEGQTPRRLNLRQTKIKISQEDVPTTIPQEHLAEWANGDDQPYYKIQKITYPIIANGLIYEESFFESFIAKLSERPIPGSRSGHTLSYGVRPPTDFIMVGAKIEKEGNGKGSVYFKNYIPKTGESGDNSGFIKSSKSDLVHFSLVTYPEEVVEVKPSGERVTRIIKSLFGERNDAVEHGTGAMEQLTNSDIRFSGKIKGKGDNRMDKEEVLKEFNRLYLGGEITLAEVALNVDRSEDIMGKDQREAVAVFNRLKKRGILDPEARIDQLEAESKANEDMVKNALLSQEFGVPDIDADGNDKNLLRLYVSQKTENIELNSLAEEIKKIKDEDVIVKKLASEIIDPDSQVNIIDSKAQNKNNPTSGIPVVDY